MIITFLVPEKDPGKSEFLTSADEMLYTMGQRAVNGRFADASECYDRYLYRTRLKE